MKWCWLFVIAALAVVALAGPAAAKEKIVWWHWNTEDRFNVFRPLIEEFEKETGIEVEAQRVSWGELREKLVISVAGGVGPDVTAVSSAWGDAVAADGMFYDLSELIAQDTELDKDDVFPAAWELWKWQGAQYAFPFDFDIACLFYNKTLFDQRGLFYPDDSFDWNKLYDAARKLTMDTDGDSKPNTYGYTSWYRSWYEWVWANDGRLFNESGTAVTLDQPAAMEALEFGYSLYDANVNCTITLAKELGAPHPPGAFKAGMVAMMPAGAWAPSIWMYDTENGQWTVDFDVAHNPRSYNGGRAVKAAGQANAIVASSEHVEAAYKFVKFLASEKVQTESGGKLGQFPVLRSVALSEAFLPPETPPANKVVFVEAAAYARPVPKFTFWNDAYKLMNSEVAKYFTGQQSLAQAVQKIKEVVTPLLKK